MACQAKIRNKVSRLGERGFEKSRIFGPDRHIQAKGDEPGMMRPGAREETGQGSAREGAA